MKIAHVTATFPPNFTGTGVVCYHNCLELGKLGHDVTVLTANYPKVEYEYPDILNVKRLDPLFRIGNGPFLPGLLKIKGFDIVHLHYPFFFGSEMIYLRSKFYKEGRIGSASRRTEVCPGDAQSEPRTSPGGQESTGASERRT